MKVLSASTTRLWSAFWGSPETVTVATCAGYRHKDREGATEYRVGGPVKPGVVLRPAVTLVRNGGFLQLGLAVSANRTLTGCSLQLPGVARTIEQGVHAAELKSG